MWQLPESELRVLGDVAGKDILELGCGAAQWSILLAGLGARPVGVDNSERQLEHARDALAAAGLDFPLVHAPAETVPLPDASFDIVFADHGANRFADPVCLGARGGAAPAAGRPPRLQRLDAASRSCAGTSRPTGWSPSSISTTSACTGSRSRTGRCSSSFRTASGSGSSARTASRSRTCGRSSLRPAAESTYRTAEETEWARKWPMEQIWIVRKER